MRRGRLRISSTRVCAMGRFHHRRGQATRKRILAMGWFALSAGTSSLEFRGIAGRGFIISSAKLRAAAIDIEPRQTGQSHCLRRKQRYHFRLLFPCRDTLSSVLRRCTVSWVGKDGIERTQECYAESLFAAAAQAWPVNSQQWFWNGDGFITVRSEGEVWKVRTERVGVWRSEQGRAERERLADEAMQERQRKNEAERR